MLKLYEVTDWDGHHETAIGCWWDAVWTFTETQALKWAQENYGGECCDENVPLVVYRVHEPREGVEPRQEHTHREDRIPVLRLLGWHCYGEVECQECELYAYGLEEFTVCDDCYLCRECRKHVEDEPCPSCQAAFPTKDLT